MRQGLCFQTHTFRMCEIVGNIFYFHFCAKVCESIHIGMNLPRIVWKNTKKYPFFKMGSEFQIVLKCSVFIEKHCQTRQNVRLDPFFKRTLLQIVKISETFFICHFVQK